MRFVNTVRIVLTITGGLEERSCTLAKVTMDKHTCFMLQLACISWVGLRLVQSLKDEKADMSAYIVDRGTSNEHSLNGERRDTSVQSLGSREESSTGLGDVVASEGLGYCYQPSQRCSR